MISKNEIKYIQSLYHKKYRDKENVFVAEGRKLIEELLLSDFVVKKIYTTDAISLKKNEIGIIETITEDELKKISNLETPNKSIAIVKKKINTEPPIFKNKISIALDGIQDPGNFGTIIRIADWFGIGQIIASPDSVDVYNPKTVQATMGSIFRVNVLYKELDIFLSQKNAKVFGAQLKGSNVQNHKPVSEGIVLIGNESRGIREYLFPFIDESVAIPSFGKAESLNAAIATGIILSHFVHKN